MNTRFVLMAQYGARAIIPLDAVARDYFSMTPDKLIKKIRCGEVALPIMRMDPSSQKTLKGVHIEDLAIWVESEMEAAKAKPRFIFKTEERRIKQSQNLICGYVYFLKNGDFLKIGFSVKPDGRVKSMMTGNPHNLELLHVVKGTRVDEREFHRRFEAYHHRLEWFRYEGELREWIEARA